MAIPKVIITGKVLLPSGAAPASGYLLAKLSQAGSALDGAQSERVGAAVRATLGSDGSLPASWGLVPNDAIVPSGTYYAVDVHLFDDKGVPFPWKEKWQLSSSPSTQDIGAVTRIEGVPPAALTPTLAIAQAQADAAAASAAAAAASAAQLLSIDGGAPDTTWGGTVAALDGGTP